MGTQEIRKARLEQLIAEVGSAAAVANRIGKADNYISRMRYPRGKRGGKPITADTAHDIEQAFNKPPGWMSQPIEDAERSNVTQPKRPEIAWPLSVPVEIFQALDRKTRDELDDAFTRMVMGAQAQSLVRRKSARKAG